MSAPFSSNKNEIKSVGGVFIFDAVEIEELQVNTKLSTTKKATSTSNIGELIVENNNIQLDPASTYGNLNIVAPNITLDGDVTILGNTTTIRVTDIQTTSIQMKDNIATLGEKNEATGEDKGIHLVQFQSTGNKHHFFGATPSLKVSDTNPIFTYLVNVDSIDKPTIQVTDADKIYKNIFYKTYQTNIIGDAEFSKVYLNTLQTNNHTHINNNKFTFTNGITGNNSFIINYATKQVDTLPKLELKSTTTYVDVPKITLKNQSFPTHSFFSPDSSLTINSNEVFGQINFESSTNYATIAAGAENTTTNKGKLSIFTKNNLRFEKFTFGSDGSIDTKKINIDDKITLNNGIEIKGKKHKIIFWSTVDSTLLKCVDMRLNPYHNLDSTLSYNIIIEEPVSEANSIFKNKVYEAKYKDKEYVRIKVLKSDLTIPASLPSAITNNYNLYILSDKLEQNLISGLYINKNRNDENKFSITYDNEFTFNPGKIHLSEDSSVAIENINGKLKFSSLGGTIFIGDAINSRNNAFGENALDSLLVGSDQFNTAVGFQSLQLLKDGKKNTAIGSKVFKNADSCNFNTVIGFNAGTNYKLANGTLANVKKAEKCVFLGNEIIAKDSILSNQIVIGNEAISEGDSTLVLGNRLIQKTYLRGQINIYDHGKRNNIALGTSTLDNNTLGKNNTAVGDSALFTNISGNNNTAIGKNALYKNTDGKNNTIMGFNAGSTLTTGDSNVIIGYEADVNDKNSLNRIVIGSRAIGFRDSTVVLGDSLTIQKTYLRGQINIYDHGRRNNIALGTSTLEKNTFGKNNTAVGDSALFTNISGDNNTAIGKNALYKNTDGKNNTIMGFNAGSTLTTGDSNVIIGYEADVNDKNSLNRIVIGSRAIGFRDSTVVLGDSLTIQKTYLRGQINIYDHGRRNNIALGTSTLEKNTLGKNNTAIGDSALFTNVSGNNNTAIGKNALYKNTDGKNNTIMGFNAATTLTTGDSNVIIGYEANVDKADALNRIVIGSRAIGFRDSTVVIGDSLTIQKTYLRGQINIYDHGRRNNIALGTSTLEKNTLGKNNTAVGDSALFTNISGDNNTAIGKNALYKNTDGKNNTIMGFNAGSTLTTGDSNVIIGYEANVDKADALNRIVIGSRAIGFRDSTVVIGDSLTIQKTYLRGQINIYDHGRRNNIALGTSTLDNNTLGKNNTAVGDSALFTNISGNNNTAIGKNALYKNTDGKNNTIMGFNAGSTLTTGDSNVIIGYKADVNDKNALNRIVIGSRAIGFRDSTVVLGDSLTIQKTYLRRTN